MSSYDGDHRPKGSFWEIAYAILLCVVIVIAGLCFIFLPFRMGRVIADRGRAIADRERNYKDEIKSARELVIQWADRLSLQSRAGGGMSRFNQLDVGQIPCLDPWHSNLRYAYFNDSLTDYLQVRSLGPDRIIDTLDDIIETREVDIIHLSE